jgi:hypothetical protein
MGMDRWKLRVWDLRVRQVMKMMRLTVSAVELYLYYIRDADSPVTTHMHDNFGDEKN